MRRPRLGRLAADFIKPEVRSHLYAILISAIAAISIPSSPGLREANWDYQWIDARNFGQSSYLLEWLRNSFSFIDLDFELGYNTLSFHQHPLNPFFVLSYFGWGLYSIHVSIIFIRIAAGYSIFRILVLTIGRNSLYPLAIFAALSAFSFQFYLYNMPTLNSLLFVFIYAEVFIGLIKTQTVSPRLYFLMALCPFVSDIHAPPTIVFLGVFILVVALLSSGFHDLTSVLKRRSFALNVMALAVVHAVVWLPWLISVRIPSTGRLTALTFEMLLPTLGGIFTSTNSIHKFFLDHSAFYAIIQPYIGSATQFYLPLGLLTWSFFVLFAAREDRVAVLARRIAIFGVFLFLCVYFVNSDFGQLLFGRISFFRYPANVIPPLFVIASSLTFYRRPQYILFTLPFAVLAFCFDFNIGSGYSGLSLLLTVTYVAVLVPTLIWYEEISGLVAIALVVGSYHAIIALSGDISSPIHKIEDRGDFWKGSQSALDCLEKAAPPTLGSRVLFTGISKFETGVGRLYNEEMSNFMETARARNINILFSYRETMNAPLVKAYNDVFEYGGTSRFPPEIQNVRDLESVKRLGVSTVAVFWMDRESVIKKFGSGLEYATTCDGPVNRFDVYKVLHPYGIAYAVDPDGEVEPVERLSKQRWSWPGGGSDGKKIVFAIANYPALNVYQNGVRLVKADTSLISIDAPKDAGPIRIKERSWVGTFATFSFFFMLALFAYAAFIYPKAYLARLQDEDRSEV